MNPLFQTLAELHRKSPLRQRDFTIDYEKFLRLADMADGDDRELAEKELRLAESESDGALKIDRAKKSNLPERIRIAREGGEAWLFSKTGAITPAAEREEMIRFFRRSSRIPVPEKWQSSWREWCGSLAEKVRKGSSMQPFTTANRADLIQALTGVLNWQGDSLIRYASARICGDSKALQALEPRLLAALREIAGGTSLEDFGILPKPRQVMGHGSLKLGLENGVCDLSLLPGHFILSETNLVESLEITTSAKLCLTVENEDVFMEIAKRNPGILLIQTSFPGSAVRRLVSRLPEMDFLHFGDSDPAGFDILRDLREKTGRNFRPLMMEHRPANPPVPFSTQERETLIRLIGNPLMADIGDMLADILEAGDKGDFEQETIPVEQVLARL